MSSHDSETALRTNGPPGAQSVTPTGNVSPDRLKHIVELVQNMETNLSELYSLPVPPEILQFLPQDNHDRLETCLDYTEDLSQQAQDNSDELLRTAAVLMIKAALDACPSGHQRRAGVCSNLAYLLTTHADGSADDSMLYEVVALEQEALLLLSYDHPNRQCVCGNLAVSLKTLFTRTGEGHLLDQIIALEREALHLRPSGDPNRGISCSNLGVSLKMRFDRTGDNEDLEDAIALGREAVSLHGHEHISSPQSLSNLATSLWAKANLEYDEGVLLEAISLERSAIASCDETSEERPKFCTNLASMLCTLHEKTGDIAALDEAIALESEVLHSYPSGHADRGISLSNLAVSLKTRYEQNGDMTMLDQALVYNLDALQYPDVDRWRIHLNTADLHLYELAPIYNPGRAISQLINAADTCVNDIPELMRYLVKRLIRIGVTHIPAADRPQLLTLYSKAVHFMPLVAGFALSERSQLRAFESCAQLASYAFVGAIYDNNIASALELLEHARGVIWSQALHLQDPQAEEIPPDLAQELSFLLASLSSVRLHPSHSSTRHHVFRKTYRDVRHEQNARILEILHDARSRPGLERFMMGPSYASLIQAARAHPLVVLASAEGFSHALILGLPDGSASHLPLGKVDPAAFQISFLNDYSRPENTSLLPFVSGAQRGVRLSPALPEFDFEDPLELLWIQVVQPILRHLCIQKAAGSSRPRLHWCPTGDFTFIPLHAAGIYDGPNQECCADFVVSSYTPTISALQRARRPVLNPSSQPLNVLLVSESAAPGVSRLYHVQAELERITNVMRRTDSVALTTVSNPATVDNVSTNIPAAQIVHMACHGVQNWDDALDSGFCLRDGDLTISALMKLKLDNGLLAFLSACETAKGDQRQPDQIIHLAAAMLFAGFRNVIATLWSMNDTDGPLVASIVYEELLSNGVFNPERIPYALDAAVQRLRADGASPYRWATFVHLGA